MNDPDRPERSRQGRGVGGRSYDDVVDGVTTQTTTQTTASTTAVPLAEKGQLRPEGPFSISRLGLDDEFAALARQVWIPRWSLPEGVVHHQPVLNYPAVNVVVEHDHEALHFPSSGVGERELHGDGWAVGVLLRPGAGWLVAPVDHSLHLGAEQPIPDGEQLVGRIRAAMVPDDRAGADAEALAAYCDWLRPWLERVDDQVLLVNAVCDAVEHDVSLRGPADLVELFGVSERSLQRLLRTRVGVPPSWLFQRRRLQEAAFRIREEPDLTLAALAVDLGYADQSHFTRDFRAVVGESPGRYRDAQAGDADQV